ncbi:uncharacterized protein LOC127255252 [Andrographis paniculata]|uniref:uncharacterized protein LOC127255252 n=1 Tax=Andrographis paniculata TaxID=175694 RepID=UPI0021E84983|nr:uncharacterized protein LOC127255252 [Andrographis paniculata]XP_051136678.1 uncharacterized protein LOC127255252 [Andrographis paniculata]XP_051136679.1 uncharacterized protein LOC127255252 [Andrographis paniculata]
MSGHPPLHPLLQSQSLEDLDPDPFDVYQSALPEDSIILDSLQASVLTAAASLSLDQPRHRQLEDLADRLGETSGHLKMLQRIRNANDSKLKELAALEAQKAACAQSFLDEKQHTEDEMAYIEGLRAEEEAPRAELSRIEERLKEIPPESERVAASLASRTARRMEMYDQARALDEPLFGLCGQKLVFENNCQRAERGLEELRSVWLGMMAL